jgi:hypothetical protein
MMSFGLCCGGTVQHEVVSVMRLLRCSSALTRAIGLDLSVVRESGALKGVVGRCASRAVAFLGQSIGSAHQGTYFPPDVIRNVRKRTS